MSPEVARAAACIAEAADRPSACGVRWLRLRPLCNDHETDAAIHEAGRRVRALGFVAIRASAEVSAAAARDAAHRHVVLFASTSRDRLRVVGWIRALSMASPRAHLVVEFRWPGEERAATAPVSHARLPATHARERALEVELDDRLVRATTDWERHASLAAETARARFSTGELRLAEGLLAGITAEAAHRDVAVPAGVRLAWGELCFWQGRFEEAGAHFDGSSDALSEPRTWRALVAWARNDRADFCRLLGRYGEGGLTSLTALGHAMAGDEGRTVRSVEARLARADEPSPLGRFVDQAVLIEALVDVDRRAWAVELLGPPRPSQANVRLEDVLLDRLRSACRRDAADSYASHVRQFIDRTGARGLTRWGLGRPTMSVLHAVPALLQLVQESDDELVTLRRGCAWMRRHTGADAVGVVAGEGAGVVAADGLQPGDMIEGDIAGAVSAGGARTVACVAHAIVVSPVRYGGVTIGSVVAKGRPEAAETLRDAAAALAALLGATLRARLDAVSAAGSRAGVAPEILGRSPAVAAVREAIARAAGTNFAVLVEGESGTGKELVARALHRLSARRDRRLAAVNCAALTDELIEAELFGHTRGAFTGAVGARTGLFEEAHGSTLFLDEVGELSARGQAKLLRVLQEREIRRLGENASRPIDVRVIAATNVPLAEAVARGRFREDLLFRLAVVRIRVPSLRDRIEDVPLLAQAFWKPLMTETGKRAILGPDALGELCRHRWPGNVRELQNVVSGLAVSAPAQGHVRARHVSAVLATVGPSCPGPAASLELALRGFERQVVSAALARHAGRRTSAARELGLTRQGLTKAIRRLGLAPGQGNEDVA